MDTINLVFNLVNNLKYYLEIDGVMVFPEKHQSKYCSPVKSLIPSVRSPIISAISRILNNIDKINDQPCINGLILSCVSTRSMYRPTYYFFF